MSAKSITSVEPTARVTKQEPDPRFPYGSITLSWPDWNNLVSHVMYVERSLKPLRKVLAHVELGTGQEALASAAKDSADSLWSALYTLDVLVREIKSSEGTGNGVVSGSL